ncbi:MAG TPA: tetratricopeptide repeat protein [Bryobacteraceae bacterium]|nr:tetratricopeptide repeat protein [Bryobacteraceae bacterium]
MFFRKWMGVAASVAVGTVLVTGVAQIARAQQATQAQNQGGGTPPQKKVKDQGEYDLFNKFLKDFQGNTDPNTQLQDLATWTQKYPESDYKDDRIYYTEQVYAKMKQPDKVLEYGEQYLKTPSGQNKDTIRANALYMIALNAQAIGKPTPEQVEQGRAAAQELIDNLNVFFADNKKPANMSEADWTKTRGEVEKLANATLTWVNAAMAWTAMQPGDEAMQKKDYATAEQIYTQALQKYPNSGLAAYQLGRALIFQQNPDKNAKAIYEIARAAALDPAQGGLNPQMRTQVDNYLKKVYSDFHGSDEGLDQLKQQALTAPFPSADFKIQSKAEIEAAKQAQFQQEHPELAAWLAVKEKLVAPDGSTYFDSQVKGTQFPQLKGTVVDAKPACRSRELVVAVSDATTPEVTLKLDAALTGKPALGTAIQWEGVPSAFTQQPFMLTMDTEKAKVDGLNVTPCVAARPARKGTTKRKR